MIKSTSPPPQPPLDPHPIWLSSDRCSPLELYRRIWLNKPLNFEALKSRVEMIQPGWVFLSQILVHKWDLSVALFFPMIIHPSDTRGWNSYLYENQERYLSAEDYIHICANVDDCSWDFLVTMRDASTRERYERNIPKEISNIKQLKRHIKIWGFLTMVSFVQIGVELRIGFLKQIAVHFVQICGGWLRKSTEMCCRPV